MNVNTEYIKRLEDEGLISVREKGGLQILNYTSKVQYERLWDDFIKQCRGLIIDFNGEIIERPFPKFFNVEEHEKEDIPNESFDVFEKMDGSLGILYNNNGWKISTRGSFESDQAIKATEMLHSKYADFHNFDNSKTYLFEIIYPENRIVVDYGSQEKLVLLAIIDTHSGKEESIFYFEWPDKVKKYDGINDIYSLKEKALDNKEGFVIRFKSGFRIKVKFEEYVRLHRIITQISNKSIWEMLKNEDDFEEIIERVPDEFYDWIKQTKAELETEFESAKRKVLSTFSEAPTGTRKDFALWAKEQKHPSCLFGLYDDRDIDGMIWDKIKPEYQKPFYNEN